MNKITKNYKINASVENVWECLTNQKRIEQWTASLCRMTEKEGDEFSLWNGDIWGKNLKVVKEKELIQEWYSGEWRSPSTVRFMLKEKNGITTLTLTHSEFPEKEFKSIDSGWDNYYLEPLKLVAESM